MFARLGPHPRDLLPARAADGELFEYWGHQASLIPVEHHRCTAGRWRRPREQRVAARRPHERGAAGLRRVDLPDGRRAGAGRRRRPLAAHGAKGTWWDWDHAKLALEWLFCSGRVTARRRVNDFARLYDLPERMLPPAVLAVPTPPEADARKALLVQAARSLGVATLRDLADYHRQLDHDVPAARPRAGRGRAAGPGDGRGLAGARPTSTPRPSCPAGSAPAPCSPRSTRWCGSDRGSSGCSASTTGSRSTRRRRSGGTATTCCRSCSVTSSSAGST